MAEIHFTSHLRNLVTDGPLLAAGATVGEALANVLAAQPLAQLLGRLLVGPGAVDGDAQHLGGVVPQADAGRRGLIGIGAGAGQVLRLQGIPAGHAQSRQRARPAVPDQAAVVEDLLELRRGGTALSRGQIGLSTNVCRVERGEVGEERNDAVFQGRLRELQSGQRHRRSGVSGLGLQPQMNVVQTLAVEVQPDDIGLGGTGDHRQALRGNPGQEAPAGRLEQRFRPQEAQHLLGILRAAPRPEAGARTPGQDDAKEW